MKTKFCLSYRQSFGLFGVKCYLCQYNFFPEPTGKQVTGKNETFQNITFQKNSIFLKTEQLTLITQ